MKNVYVPALCVLSVLLLGACREPGSPSPAAAPATAGADSVAKADAAFAATAATELDYAQRSVPLLPSRECNLERANGDVFSGVPVQVAAGEPLRLSGWVVDKQAGTVPDSAVLRLAAEDSRSWQVPLQLGGKRDDVVQLLGGDTAYVPSGFVVTLDTRSLPAGRYRVYTVFQGQDGMHACDNGRAVVIGG